MSDSYQPIYDAVRSRISGGDISGTVERVLRESCDLSWEKSRLNDAIAGVQYDLQRPSVLFRPSLTLDGNKWCAMYGPNLMEGVAAFGDSPDEAMHAFDKAWNSKIGAST